MKEIHDMQPDPIAQAGVGLGILLIGFSTASWFSEPSPLLYWTGTLGVILLIAGVLWAKPSKKTSYEVYLSRFEAADLERDLASGNLDAASKAQLLAHLSARKKRPKS